MARNRRILLAGLLTAGVLLLVYALVLYPRQQTQDLRLQKESRELEAIVQSSQRQLEATRAAVEELLREGVPVSARLQGAVVAGSTVALRGIDEWVRRSGVVLTRLEPDASEERPPVTVHAFHVELTGGFREICAFLHGVEQGVGIVPLQWSIESDPKAPRGLRAVCRLAFHEWRGAMVTPPRRGGEAIQALATASDRDPFSRGRQLAAPQREDGADPTLVLTGILAFGDKRKAIINGRAYAVGEALAGGRRVQSIGDEDVVVEGEARPLRIQRALQRVAPAGGRERGAGSRR
jgi:Tfp pilus assembly protein PilO